jgi:hypothetical protein
MLIERADVYNCVECGDPAAHILKFKTMSLSLCEKHYNQLRVDMQQGVVQPSNKDMWNNTFGSQKIVKDKPADPFKGRRTERIVGGKVMPDPKGQEPDKRGY